MIIIGKANSWVIFGSNVKFTEIEKVVPLYHVVCHMISPFKYLKSNVLEEGIIIFTVGWFITNNDMAAPKRKDLLPFSWGVKMNSWIPTNMEHV